jgi:hypothetical protein
VPKILPEGRFSLGRYGVVVGNGRDGADGGGWAENGDNTERNVAQSDFFSPILDHNQGQIIDF